MITDLAKVAEADASGIPFHLGHNFLNPRHVLPYHRCSQHQDFFSPLTSAPPCAGRQDSAQVVLDLCEELFGQ
jgi:hypothetical protein